jgi:hypothetical protein
MKMKKTLALRNATVATFQLGMGATKKLIYLLTDIGVKYPGENILSFVRSQLEMFLIKNKNYCYTAISPCLFQQLLYSVDKFAK